jgi:hypothetical protein
MPPFFEWLSPSAQPKCVDINGTGARCLVRDVLAKHSEAALTQLAELHAAGNEISRVDAVVCRTLRSLRLICLSGNRLRTLPAEIGCLRSLTSLRIEGNQLTALPWQLGELRQLEQLWLGCNELSEVPASIGGARELRELCLGGNQLTLLPAEIGLLGRLERLELAHNQLTSLPDALAGLHRLHELVVRGNALMAVPLCLLPGPGALATLDLSYNALCGALPAELAARPVLTSVPPQQDPNAGSRPSCRLSHTTACACPLALTAPPRRQSQSPLSAASCDRTRRRRDPLRPAPPIGRRAPGLPPTAARLAATIPRPHPTALARCARAPSRSSACTHAATTDRTSTSSRRPADRAAAHAAPHRAAHTAPHIAALAAPRAAPRAAFLPACSA